MKNWIDKQTTEFQQKLNSNVVRFFEKVQRPAFLGEIAIEAGLSLSQAESLVANLALLGVVRLATQAEITLINGNFDAVVYALVKVVS